MGLQWRKKVTNHFKVLVWCSFLLFCSSCDSRSEEVILLSYNWFDSADKQLSSDTTTITLLENGAINTVEVSKGGQVLFTYKQVYDKDSGLYNFCDGVKVLTHSFYDSLSLYRYCKAKSPFLSEETILVDSKKYSSNGKNFVVFQYKEFNTMQAPFYSYYLDEIGFICYYDFESDIYLKPTYSTKHWDVVKDITQQLVSDSTFFARFILNKASPDFYRGSGYE
ncbi:hypothetical protein [Pontibacter amylolyticus]|uniref:Lipoprotein n=1 Tax=Pontibacter amylolyticus TaxID=1424080 RepID=A0ABQ1W8C9_9BACT|nr:hypothetical protein [Pontibacter amylolyticus]GGG19029.1 hypothetical protein GCM10011323_23950 [Pontibacter amylolyticus]